MHNGESPTRWMIMHNTRARLTKRFGAWSKSDIMPIFDVKEMLKLYNKKLTEYFRNAIRLPSVKGIPELLSVLRQEMRRIEDTTPGITAALRAGMYCIAYTNATSGKQNYSWANKTIHYMYDLIR